MGRQINNVDVVGVGFPHVINRYMATVAVNNEEALVVGVGWFGLRDEDVP